MPFVYSGGSSQHVLQPHAPATGQKQPRHLLARSSGSGGQPVGVERQTGDAALR